MARPPARRPSQEPESESPASDTPQPDPSVGDDTYGLVSLERMRKDDGRALLVYARADGRP